MTTRLQILRSSIAGSVPTQGTRQPGELWTTFPDLQLGVIDTTRTAQKLVAIRFFSTAANYTAGDFVVQAGGLYVANTAVTAGAFNATQWTKVAALTDIPAAYTLPTASSSVLGGVKIDGTTVAINGAGVISAPGAVASSTTPLMDGAAAIGSGTTYARADHIHPSDTSKLSLTGTTTNDNAAAGAIGEYISSNVLSGSSILMTTAVVLNITSISLTAGDWDVQGEAWLSTGAAANLSQAWGSISTVSGALGGGGAAQAARCGFAVAYSPSTIQVFPLRTTRLSIATTTTVYLTALAGFSAGGVNAYGNISARRVR